MTYKIQRLRHYFLSSLFVGMIIFGVFGTNISEAHAVTSGGTGGTTSAICSGGTCKFENPFGMGTTMEEITGNLIKTVFRIVGSLALLMFVWGGFLWLTAAGEDKRVKQGWSTMVWAVLGMIAIFGAYVAADFVLKGFLQATK